MTEKFEEEFDNDFGGNIMVETLMKMGVNNFLDGIRKAIIIQKVPKVQDETYPPIPVIEESTNTAVTGVR